MNAEQWKSLLRSILLTGAGLLGGIGIAKGWYTTEQLTGFLNSQLGIGVIGFIVTTIFGILNKSAPNLVAQTASLPGVTVVAPPSLANTPSNITNPSVQSTTESQVTTIATGAVITPR